MTTELERELEQSEQLRKNIEYIRESAPKVKEVYEQLTQIEESGIAPIQKALDEIKILKEGQTARHELILELRHVAEQVLARDQELTDLEKEVLQLLKKRLKEPE